MKAFNCEGLDKTAQTVVFEVRRELCAPIANLIQSAPDMGKNKTHFAIRKLGEQMRNAARVLYNEAEAEQFGFELLDPVEEDEQVRTGTGC